MRIPQLLFFALCIALFAASASGATIIMGPTQLSVTDQGTYSYVNGSGGGNSSNLVNGLTGSTGYMRLAQNTPLPAAFRFNFLQGPQSIHGVSIWNDRGATGDGISTFNLELFDGANNSLYNFGATIQDLTVEHHIFWGNPASPTVVSGVAYAILSVSVFYGTPGPDGAAHQVREVGFNPVAGTGGTTQGSPGIPGASVPEPATGVLVLIPALWFAWKRRRR